jgi:hypothetical protein
LNPNKIKSISCQSFACGLVAMEAVAEPLVTPLLLPMLLAWHDVLRQLHLVLP